MVIEANASLRALMHRNSAKLAADKGYSALAGIAEIHRGGANIHTAMSPISYAPGRPQVLFAVILASLLPNGLHNDGSRLSSFRRGLINRLLARPAKKH